MLISLSLPREKWEIQRAVRLHVGQSATGSIPFDARIVYLDVDEIRLYKGLDNLLFSQLRQASKLESLLDNFKDFLDVVAPDK